MESARVDMFNIWGYMKDYPFILASWDLIIYHAFNHPKKVKIG